MWEAGRHTGWVREAGRHWVGEGNREALGGCGRQGGTGWVWEAGNDSTSSNFQ